MGITGGPPSLTLRRTDALLLRIGLFALVVAADLVVFLVVGTSLDGASPRELYVPWLSAVAVGAVGFVMASGGTADPRTLIATVRDRSVATTATVLSASAVAILLTAVLGKLLASVSAGSVVVLTVAAAVAAGAVLRLRAPAEGAAPDLLSPKTIPNLLIATLLATTAATVGLGLRDVFPLSRYPMYSAPRYDPYTVGRVRFVVSDGDGHGRELRRPASRLVLVEMAETGDDDALRRLASELASGNDVPAVSALFEQARLLPYPSPPVTGFTIVREVTGNADHS